MWFFRTVRASTANAVRVLGSLLSAISTVSLVLKGGSGRLAPIWASIFSTYDDLFHHRFFALVPQLQTVPNSWKDTAVIWGIGTLTIYFSALRYRRMVLQVGDTELPYRWPNDKEMKDRLRSAWERSKYSICSVGTFCRFFFSIRNNFWDAAIDIARQGPQVCICFRNKFLFLLVLLVASSILWPWSYAKIGFGMFDQKLSNKLGWDFTIFTDCQLIAAVDHGVSSVAHMLRITLLGQIVAFLFGIAFLLATNTAV